MLLCQCTSSWEPRFLARVTGDSNIKSMMLNCENFDLNWKYEYKLIIHAPSKEKYTFCSSVYQKVLEAFISTPVSRQ